jgi:hypothetical protein
LDTYPARISVRHHHSDGTRRLDVAVTGRSHPGAGPARVLADELEPRQHLTCHDLPFSDNSREYAFIARRPPQPDSTLALDHEAGRIDFTENR